MRKQAQVNWDDTNAALEDACGRAATLAHDIGILAIDTQSLVLANVAAMLGHAATELHQEWETLNAMKREVA